MATIRRVAMTERTRQDLERNNALVSTAPKGKTGHSKKCRTFLADQKYPIVPSYNFRNWR